MDNVTREIRKIQNKLVLLGMSAWEKRIVKVGKAAEVIQDNADPMDSRTYDYLNRLVCEGKSAIITHSQRVYSAVGEGSVLEWLNRELDKS